ncbi:glycine cleavage system aminomethyltransferase GcvT [Devosia algicola]|uniref:aminomethyltransferase n=1 Tax=Devosia algicola TaxID=3026418 RepID=A0ABY7YMY1_9HYPH|nr:glycine cleavage system aminomethyltransferase GcvT [Devosia algicola]WDR02518.1 glycine cleavage system aminomethyltransferase GcvT [Devosia algicola]
MAETPSAELKTTPLSGRHQTLGGRIVPFAGYGLPVQYPSGIMAEHNWTRQHAGLFDVSHMGPCFLQINQKSGDVEADHKAIAALVEPLICGDITNLKPGQIRYTLLLNETGGALDDLMIARPAAPEQAGSLYIVVNAGTKDADFSRIAAAAQGRATLNRADNGALLALQGPDAVQIMGTIVPAATDLGFMNYGSFAWNGTTLTIARSGYTGEDGFEILVAAEFAEAFWDKLLSDERVKPIGLGARDSLRLEAGLPLYGHDLDETVSPTEAGMGFAVSKRRREAGDFPGANRISKEHGGDLSRIRIGLFVEGAPAREGADILDGEDNIVGTITSGGFSPTLGRAIALGFVPPTLATPGTILGVAVRGRTQRAEVADTPFVPHRYFRKPKP